jgi:mono/diheme cytochrome c family protein
MPARAASNSAPARREKPPRRLDATSLQARRDGAKMRLTMRVSRFFDPSRAVLFAAALGTFALVFSVTPQARAQESGKRDYLQHCAPCHGADGKGKGERLYIIPQIKPTDLTQLSKRNGGKFPFDAVAQTIDGRRTIPSHKRFDMPFWGVKLQQSGKEFTPESEARVKRRITDIVRYVESLQEK